MIKTSGTSSEELLRQLSCNLVRYDETSEELSEHNGMAAIKFLAGHQVNKTTLKQLGKQFSRRKLHIFEWRKTNQGLSG